MAILRQRLPSRQETLLVLAACVFPVHVWTIINVLREVPAWVLRLSAWELVGVISYALLVALLESLLLTVGLVALGVILPRALFGDAFVAHATMVVLLTCAWAVVAHYNTQAIRLWGLRQFAMAGMAYLATVGVGYLLVRGVDSLKRGLVSIVDRLSLLSHVYLFIDLLAVGVVVLRNTSGGV